MSEYDFHWSCDRRALKSALDRLKKSFDARVSIPLVGQLEVTPDPFNGGAVLRVTDLESHHSVPVPGSCSGDRLMVDFRQLLKIVDALPDGEVVLEATRDKVLGRLGKKTFSLFRWDHTNGNALPDAPTCPDGFPRTTVELDLAALLAPVLHAVAPDDSRYGLNGAQLEFYPDGSVGAVATDGHRMVAHMAQLGAEEHGGPLLPLGFCKKLKDVAPGRVTLTWWRPLLVSGVLSGLATMDQSRLREDSPLYRVRFDLGTDASRTVVRSRDVKRVRNGDGTFSNVPEDKISVIQDRDPRTATCTVWTTQETLDLLLTSMISLDDWLALPGVSVSGDASHLQALYEEIGRSDVIRIEHLDGTVVTARCLDEDFPNWRRIVPSRFLRSAVVDRKVLDDAVRYVMTVASTKTHCVRLALRGGEVSLSASNPDEGDLSDSVSVETSGDLCLTAQEVSRIVQWRREQRLPEAEDPTIVTPFTIGLNGQYLRDELRVLGSDRVELRFGDSLNPVILRRPGDDSLLCIVMPMRLE